MMDLTSLHSHWEYLFPRREAEPAQENHASPRTLTAERPTGVTKHNPGEQLGPNLPDRGSRREDPTTLWGTDNTSLLTRRPA